MSTQKMTKFEKQVLKARVSAAKAAGITIASDGYCMTVGAQTVGNYTRISTAVCGDSEPKFRKSIGKRMVLDRLEYGEFIVIPGEVTAQEFLDTLSF